VNPSDRHLEYLGKILPEEMIDRAERKLGIGFSIQQILQFIPLETFKN